jgi:hypothetical protein
MADGHKPAYDDGRIVCDDAGLLIRWYYLWGAKRIPYTALKGLSELPLTGASKVRRWRLWGSGDFLHWWNLDPGRPHKSMALVLDTGHHIRPTITPDNPDSVERILREHLQESGR